MGYGAFDNAGPEGEAGKLAKALKQAASASYGTAGPEFVRRLIAGDVTGEDVRALVADFTASEVSTHSEGQIDRAAQRLELIAAAGELATRLGVTPWREGDARGAAAWALGQWIDLRGGTEPVEVRQAVEQVRLFIEAHGESRFEPVDDPEARPVDVQVQIANGNVVFTVVGLGDMAVAESRERVRAALNASGLAMPAKHITVNLAPADLPKEGSHYDLPIALGLMAAISAIPPDSFANYCALRRLKGHRRR